MQAVKTSSATPAQFGIRGDYQHQDSTQTLREGLAEYYRVNPGLSVPAEIADEKSAAYFHSHDCTHVFFGTHTGVLDEGVNDLLTLVSVNVAYRDYIRGFLATDESKKIMEAVLNTNMFKVAWWTLTLMPKAWRQRRAMTKKWPWTPPAELLDRQLVDIRREYGLEIFRPEVELGLD